MNRPPDDFFDMNDNADLILEHLSKKFEKEEDWMHILMMCATKIIYHSYPTCLHDNCVDRLSETLKLALKHAKNFER